VRALTSLLDEWVPVVAGSEIRDDPYRPVSRPARDLVDSEGDATPLHWVHRDTRFSEKLATPDTSIADLIGEVDPIKVAEGRYLADELTLHFGLVPRSNRGIFAVNELPDLAERIQVGLLNVLEERDVQIRGFTVRLPLDIVLVATANPEDYTNRGRIITPLKDRFGAQIKTHYPPDTKTELAIIHQEARPPVDAPREPPCGGACVHGRSRGRAVPVGPPEPPRQPAFGCLGAFEHLQLRDPVGQCRAPGAAAGRSPGCSPGERPGRPHRLHPGEDRDRIARGGPGGPDPERPRVGRPPDRLPARCRPKSSGPSWPPSTTPA